MKIFAVAILLSLPSPSLHAQNRGMLPVNSQLPDTRVALVIGNGSYKDAPLQNPPNDAREMAATLRSLGFRVIEKININHEQMERAIAQFGESIRNGGVGLFYFAGHGVQVNGINYLIPVDAQIEKENEVKFRSVDVGLVLARMEESRNRLSIVILDACRNNPFARSWRSSQRGLASLEASSGTFIAYATAPGKTAADGDGQNGLYTEALLKNMKMPNLKRLF